FWLVRRLSEGTAERRKLAPKNQFQPDSGPAWVGNCCSSTMQSRRFDSLLHVVDEQITQSLVMASVTMRAVKTSPNGDPRNPCLQETKPLLALMTNWPRPWPKKTGVRKNISN
ncbi:MAG: hypothetical protein RJQ07_14855, partial [Pseudomonadales bacterium]